MEEKDEIIKEEDYNFDVENDSCNSGSCSIDETEDEEEDQEENDDTDQEEDKVPENASKQPVTVKPKVSDPFRRTIEAYLIKRSSVDSLFEKAYKKPNKNLDDCISYILTTVKESGLNGFTDDEIYGFAVHYYDEDDLKVNKLPSGARVVVNHVVELTEEEKKTAHEKAKQKAEQDAYNKITGKDKKKKTVIVTETKKEIVKEQLLF